MWLMSWSSADHGLLVPGLCGNIGGSWLVLFFLAFYFELDYRCGVLNQYEYYVGEMI